MLKAILHSKAGRIGHQKSESVRWKDLFQTREDLLTSTFFERFSYLSDDIQTSILTDWFGEEIASSFGPLEDTQFWPSYYLKSDETLSRVEPDLLLEFHSANILVEVKPPEGGQQAKDQWIKEVQSYLECNKDSQKPLYFLAIGQIKKKDANNWLPELRDTFPKLAGAAALNWQNVADQLRTVSDEHLDTRSADLRILDDMFAGLSLYGIRTQSFYWPELVAFSQSESACELTLEHPWLQRTISDIPADLTTDYSFHELAEFCSKHSPLNLNGMESWTSN